MSNIVRIVCRQIIQTIIITMAFIAVALGSIDLLFNGIIDAILNTALSTAGEALITAEAFTEETAALAITSGATEQIAQGTTVGALTLGNTELVGQITAESMYFGETLQEIGQATQIPRYAYNVYNTTTTVIDHFTQKEEEKEEK